MITATCHTPDCENEGLAIELPPPMVDSITGESEPMSAVECGACGQEITDVTGVPDPEEPEVEPHD